MPYLVVPHMRSLLRVFTLVLFINPRRAHAARVTVLGLSVCLSVCLCHIGCTMPYATLVACMPYWLYDPWASVSYDLCCIQG